MNRQNIFDECKKIYEAEVVLSVYAERLSDAITVKKEKKQIRRAVETLKAVQKRHIGSDGINLPDFIKYQYDYLYDVMIQNGEIYGAYYQIKDILEMLLKLPSLILLHGMDTYIKHGNIDENSIKLFTPFLIKAPSLGDWEALEKGFIDSENLPVSDDFKNLYHKVLAVIKRIEKKKPSYQEFTKIRIENSKEKRVTFSGYRNAKMGHGATSIVIDKFFEEFKSFLSLLNSILDKSSYDGVHFEEQDGELCIRCDANETGQLVTASPYIKVCVQDAMPVVSMMESYYGKKRTAYLLNYNTGGVEENKALFETLQQVNNRIISAGKKLVLPELSNKNMKDEENISESDYKSTIIDTPFVIENRALKIKVDEWLKHNRNTTNDNICFIQAERGMGKSVFARTYTNESMLSLATIKTTKLCEDQQFIIWSFSINDTFSSSTHQFCKRMLEFFDVFLTDYRRKNNQNKDFKNSYLKAKSKLLANVLDDKDTRIDWYNYFIQLANEAPSKILFIIDGVDEIDINRPDHLRFENVFSQMDPLFIVFLGRIEKEIVNDDKTLYYYQALRNLATTNYEIDRNEPIYIDTLDNYINEQIGIDTSVDKKHLLQIAEYRFVYVSMLCRIYRANPEAFNANLEKLNNEKASFIKTYLDSICFIDKKYRDNLERLLLTLHLVQGSATREELSYLLFNCDYDRPDFQINALLQDLGIVYSKRTAQGNSFSLDHEIWKNELAVNNKLESVKNDLQQRAEAVARGITHLPYIKNWTILICNFLNKELYCDETIVENILSFVNGMEVNADVYVQERIVKILTAISNKSDVLTKELVYKIKNQLAIAHFNCGHYHDGTSLIVDLEKAIKKDNTIDNAVKALTYFNLGNYWERFETINNKTPLSSKTSYARALDYLKESNKQREYYDFNHIICLLKLGEKEIVTGSLENADDCYLKEAELIAHNLAGNKNTQLLRLYVDISLIIMRLSINNTLSSDVNNEVYIKKMLEFLALKQEDYLNLQDSTIDVLFKLPAWNKKKLDLRINTIIAEEYHKQSNFEKADEYIEQAISLAYEMVYLSSVQGCFFENREIIPLKLLKLKNILYSIKFNKNKKVSIQIVEGLQAEIKNDILHEQDNNGNYAWLDEQIEELSNLKVLINNEFTKDIQVITNNLVLADKQGSTSDARYKYYLKAAQLAAMSLNLKKDAFNIDYNDKKQRESLQLIIQNYCFSNENKQKILGLLIKACSGVAFTAYSREDKTNIISSTLETIIKYGNIAILSLETILNNYQLLNTELKPSEYTLKTRLAEYYKFMAESTNNISYINKAIDILVTTQNDRDKEFFDLVETSKTINPKDFSVGKLFHEADAFFGRKEEMKPKSNKPNILIGPPSAALADAYKTKADMMLNTDYESNTAIINVLDLAINQYLTITNVGNAVNEHHWFDFDLAYCYFWKGYMLFQEGVNAHSHVHNNGCEDFFDTNALQIARYCFEKSLEFLQAYSKSFNERVKNRYKIYVQLFHICTTKFKLEVNNDVAYDYFVKFLTETEKVYKHSKFEKWFLEEYEKALKALFFSILEEKANLVEKIVNDKLGKAQHGLLEKRDIIKKEIEDKKAEIIAYQSKRLSNIRFGRIINNINSEIGTLSGELLSLEQELQKLEEEKKTIMKSISDDPNMLKEINDKIRFVQRQAKSANINLYSTREFYWERLNKDIIKILKKGEK